MLRIFFILIAIQLVNTNAFSQARPLMGKVEGHSFKYKQAIFGINESSGKPPRPGFHVFSTELKNPCEMGYEELITTLAKKGAQAVRLLTQSFYLVPTAVGSFREDFGWVDSWPMSTGTLRFEIRDFVKFSSSDISKSVITVDLETPVKQGNYLRGRFQAINCYKQ